MLAFTKQRVSSAPRSLDRPERYHRVTPRVGERQVLLPGHLGQRPGEGQSGPAAGPHGLRGSLGMSPFCLRTVVKVRMSPFCLPVVKVRMSPFAFPFAFQFEAKLAKRFGQSRFERGPRDLHDHFVKVLGFA